MKSKEFQLERVMTILRWPVAFFGAVYLVCMLAAPWFMGDRNWIHVQDVWDRWQGVNVGILAFAASFIAFEVTRYKEIRQRNREFLASRAFLPEALSELAGYLKGSAAVHMAAWNNLPQQIFPVTPVQYKDIFANCIRHADADTGEHLSGNLSEILVWLQVQDARIDDLIKNPPLTLGMKKINALDGLRLLGELQARVNKLFGFARGLEPLDSQPLTWEDYRIAYLNLGLQIDELAVGEFSLERKTKWHLAKQNGTETSFTLESETM